MLHSFVIQIVENLLLYEDCIFKLILVLIRLIRTAELSNNIILSLKFSFLSLKIYPIRKLLSYFRNHF